MSESMRGSLNVSPAGGNSQVGPWWTDPEERVCEQLMSDLIGHDTERLARRTGMERRRLNEQREPTFASTNWLRRLVRTIAAKREIGCAAEPLEAIARAFAEACGVSITTAPAVDLESGTDVLVATSSALKETTEAVSAVLDITNRHAIDRPIDLRRAEKECDESIERMQAVKAALRERRKELLLQLREGRGRAVRLANNSGGPGVASSPGLQKGR
jgi:hypothetical protein